VRLVFDTIRIRRRHGTRISCSAGCEDAGKTIQVWLEIQEI